MQIPEGARSGIDRYVPILSWLPKYQKGWLRIDLVAGLTASAVVIPQAIEAYQSMEADLKEVDMSDGNSEPRE